MSEFLDSHSNSTCPLGLNQDDLQAWDETHRPREKGYRHAATARRVIGYVRKAVERGAEFKLHCLIRRALARFEYERSERMIRYYVSAIKASGLFTVTRVRIGRSFCLLVRKIGAKISAQIHPATPTIRSLKGVKINAKPSASLSILRKFAWSLGRALEGQHWDNCKVRFDLRHAFNFAYRWLHDGRLFDEIRDAYGVAVHQRHKDATDYDLDNGQNLVRWEPSSTVSLANQILASRTNYQTWYGLLRQHAQ